LKPLKNLDKTRCGLYPGKDRYSGGRFDPANRSDTGKAGRATSPILIQPETWSGMIISVLLPNAFRRAMELECLCSPGVRFYSI